MDHDVVDPDEPSLSSLFLAPNPYEMLGADGNVSPNMRSTILISSNHILAGPDSTVFGPLGSTGIPQMQRSSQRPLRNPGQQQPYPGFPRFNRLWSSRIDGNPPHASSAGHHAICNPDDCCIPFDFLQDASCSLEIINDNKLDVIKPPNLSTERLLIGLQRDDGM